MALVSVLLAAFITRWLARSIIRPLNEMTVAAERIAEGDLAIDVEPRSERRGCRDPGALVEQARAVPMQVAAASQASGRQTKSPITCVHSVR